MNRYIKMMYAQVEPTMGHTKKGMLIIFINVRAIVITI